MFKKSIFTKILATTCSIAMLFSVLPAVAGAAIPDPLPDGVNAGVQITFNEAEDMGKLLASDGSYVADGGSTEWLAGDDITIESDGDVLKCTYDSTQFNSSWKGAYNLKLVDPISVNGTYKISYQVYVPSEGNEGKDNIRTGFVVDNGFGNGYGVTEFPNPDVTVEKDKWIDVSATIPKTAKAIDWFAFRFTGASAADAVNRCPNVYYLDNIKIELVDFDDTPVVIPGWEEDTASLKDTFADIFKMGNILQAGAFNSSDFNLTEAEFLKQYNFLTLENAMKPDQISNAKGSYNFTSADAMVNWALDKGMDVHGHVLVWHSQSPGWLNRDLTRAQAKENMEEYIKTVAEHFSGRLASWDVVNEAFYNDAISVDRQNVTDWRDGLRSVNVSGEPGSLWYTAYANGMDEDAGEHPSDYIYDAFVFARQYAPETILYYNDFNDDIPNKVNAICNMINDLNARWEVDDRNTDPDRLLVEGMGLQAHYSTTYTNNTDNVKKALEAYIATGVEISISELDVSIENATNELNTPENQQRIYKELFEIYTTPGIVEHIKRVTFWGMHDGVSWRGARRCLPFDLNQKAKPVFADIIAIGENYVTAKDEWIQDGDKWKLQLADGSFATNYWSKDGGLWYYLGEDGYLKTGWVQEDEKWYFLDRNTGAMNIGWVLDGKWYYLGVDGVMATGWLNDGGDYYYLDETNGTIITGWVEDGEDWYFMDYDTGIMTTNAWIGGYWVGSDGKWDPVAQR